MNKCKCGGTPVLQTYSPEDNADNGYFVKIVCPECGATSKEFEHSKRDYAIEDWNTKNPAPKEEAPAPKQAKK